MKAKTMHKKMPTGTALTLIIALCSLIAAPPLFAQNYGGEQGQPAQQQYRQQQERYQQGQQEQPQQGQEYQQQREQQMQQQKTKTDFSEEKLKKFVKADEAVDEVQESYSQELQQVKDRNKARELQSKYHKQLVQAIEESGLTVSQYKEIENAVRTNPDLQDKVDKLSE